jgi:hypothetical protein
MVSMNSLTLFVVLQVADIITTLVFLAIGVQEANPAVRLFLHIFSPTVSLVLVKIFGIGFGLAWYSGVGFSWQERRMKYHVVRSFTKVNGAFMVLIAWNFLAIFLQAAPKLITLLASK